MIVFELVGLYYFTNDKINTPVVIKQVFKCKGLVY